jgi:hypothetical protein
MKPLQDCKSSRNQEIICSGRKYLAGLVFLFATIMLSTSTNADAQKVNIQVNIDLPSWAPYYDNPQLVRYYYLPDIECYYDVRNREFVYMEDGEWMFGRSLPPVYAWFNLNNCFIVALNSRVIEPWRHFHYYVAHYPRYYYRTVYRDRYMDRMRPIRGFNENERNIVFNKRSDRDEYERFHKNESRHEENNWFENRQGNEPRRDYPERRVEPTRPTEPVHYYGREVGKPVKVQRNMRKVQEIKVREDHGARSNREEKSYRQR